MAEVSNRDIERSFEQIADLLEIRGEDAFRVNSYRKVARVAGETSESLATLAREGGLTDLPGIGKSSAAKIQQLVREGRIDLLEELHRTMPTGLADLLRVPGLGPKTIAKLWKQLGVEDTASLANAIEDGRIEQVEGMGPKKVRQIFEGLQFAAQAGGRARLDVAREQAGRILAALDEITGGAPAEAAGSYRRGRETVGDLDVVCQAQSDEDAKRYIQAFTAGKSAGLPIDRVLAAGETRASVVLEGGLQADLRVVGPESYGAALAYFTGSKAHNVRVREMAVKKGLKLNEYGLFRGEKRLAGDTEQSIYEAMKMQYVVPELREDRGEIEAALEHRLPALVELADIRGDLHMHTHASDGLEDIATMIRACRERGYKYMAIADHSKSQTQAHGLDERRLARHKQEVLAAAGEQEGIRVYFSCEVDILKDGALDFGDDVLETLDFAIASPHAALTLKGAEATARLIKAVEHPFVRVIAHPTGRLVNARAGMEIDIQALAEAAAAHAVALEINAHPYRLDLRDVHVQAAVAAGAKIIINTDAHGIADLDNMHMGVTTARRGWATAADVVNTLSPAKFDAWVRRRG